MGGFLVLCLLLLGLPATHSTTERNLRAAPLTHTLLLGLRLRLRGGYSLREGNAALEEHMKRVRHLRSSEIGSPPVRPRGYAEGDGTSNTESSSSREGTRKDKFDAVFSILKRFEEQEEEEEKRFKGDLSSVCTSDDDVDSHASEDTGNSEAGFMREDFANHVEEADHQEQRAARIEEREAKRKQQWMERGMGDPDDPVHSLGDIFSTIKNKAEEHQAKQKQKQGAVRETEAAAFKRLKDLKKGYDRIVDRSEKDLLNGVHVVGPDGVLRSSERITTDETKPRQQKGASPARSQTLAAQTQKLRTNRAEDAMEWSNPFSEGSERFEDKEEEEEEEEEGEGEGRESRVILRSKRVGSKQQDGDDDGDDNRDDDGDDDDEGHSQGQGTSSASASSRGIRPAEPREHSENSRSRQSVDYPSQSQEEVSTTSTSSTSSSTSSSSGSIRHTRTRIHAQKPSKPQEQGRMRAHERAISSSEQVHDDDDHDDEHEHTAKARTMPRGKPHTHTYKYEPTARQRTRPGRAHKKASTHPQRRLVLLRVKRKISQPSMRELHVLESATSPHRKSQRVEGREEGRRFRMIHTARRKEDATIFGGGAEGMVEGGIKRSARGGVETKRRKEVPVVELEMDKSHAIVSALIVEPVKRQTKDQKKHSKRLQAIAAQMHQVRTALAQGRPVEGMLDGVSSDQPAGPGFTGMAVPGHDAFKTPDEFKRAGSDEMQTVGGNERDEDDDDEDGYVYDMYQPWDMLDAEKQQQAPLESGGHTVPSLTGLPESIDRLIFDETSEEWDDGAADDRDERYLAPEELDDSNKELSDYPYTDPDSLAPSSWEPHEREQYGLPEAHEDRPRDDYVERLGESDLGESEGIVQDKWRYKGSSKNTPWSAMTGMRPRAGRKTRMHRRAATLGSSAEDVESGGVALEGDQGPLDEEVDSDGNPVEEKEEPDWFAVSTDAEDAPTVLDWNKLKKTLKTQ